MRSIRLFESSALFIEPRRAFIESRKGHIESIESHMRCCASLSDSRKSSSGRRKWVNELRESLIESSERLIESNKSHVRRRSRDLSRRAAHARGVGEDVNSLIGHAWRDARDGVRRFRHVRYPVSLMRSTCWHPSFVRRCVSGSRCEVRRLVRCMRQFARLCRRGVRDELSAERHVSVRDCHRSLLQSHRWSCNRHRNKREYERRLRERLSSASVDDRRALGSHCCWRQRDQSEGTQPVWCDLRHRSASVHLLSAAGRHRGSDISRVR